MKKELRSQPWVLPGAFLPFTPTFGKMLLPAVPKIHSDGRFFSYSP